MVEPNSVEEILTQLEQEFLPLDSALIHAIVFDYDVTNPVELAELRGQLGVLQASAVAEDTGTFDATGTSAKHGDAIKHSSDTVSETESNSIITGTSTLTVDSASGSGSSADIASAFKEYADITHDAKLAILQDLFPTLSTREVEVTLKKCHYDISKATDILLNQVFFDESFLRRDGEGPIRTRGVDAFSEDNHIPQKRGRTKNKKKIIIADDDYLRSSSMPAAQPPPSNKWRSAHEDISFIAKRVQMSENYVSSLYHKHGASRVKTIRALVDDHLRTEKHDFDPQVSAYASDLTEEFPTLSMEKAAALIRLTKQSTANAHELAKILTYSTADIAAQDLIPQYTPLKISETSPISRTPSSSASISTMSEDSRALLAARNNAFENASRYYRRGKSDKLMGGATAYYSSLGREYTASLHSAKANEADVLVASQSSATYVDLHGVTVKEAVRIACERTSSWWDALGESRIPGGARGIGPGLKIITGIGRHSEGGVAKLGPAVSRALLREGWKVEVASGELIIRGRMR